ncbi:MAG TPA: AraC family transcriptional regulator [Pontiellaceae bacterium]|nr:AraC family transcriptional regulator [Pontiellaceae bacterium]
MEDIISYGHIENELMYPHCNPGMEIVLVEQGHLEWAVEKVPEVLNPGSVFFTLPWQTHGSLQIREPRNRIFYVLFSLPGNTGSVKDGMGFPESLRFSAAEQRMLGRIFMTGPHHAWQASPLLRRLFPDLIRRLDGSSELDKMAAAALLRAILIELADIISQAQCGQGRFSSTMQKVHAFLKNLGKSLDHPWSLEEMAERCGVKRTQLTNLIKQVTGYSPTQYLNRVRFEKACELLRKTDRSIMDITLECGYSSSQYFAEAFKKNARMTPTEYRNLLPELDAILQSNWDHPERRSVEEELQRAASFGNIGKAGRK